MSRLLGSLYRVGGRLSSPCGSAARLLLLRPAPVAVAAHQRQRFDDAGSSAPEGWAFYGAAAAAIAAAAPRRFEMTGLPGGGEGDEEDGVVRGADRGELARLARDESGAPDQGERADDEEEEAQPPAGKSTARP